MADDRWRRCLDERGQLGDASAAQHVQRVERLGAADEDLPYEEGAQEDAMPM
jgi:hypothetical protein